MSTDLAFTPVPVRPRRDGWTPLRQTMFVLALADIRCVVAAATVVGMSWQTAYRLRARPDASSFAAAWNRALARPLPDASFTGRAMGGTAKPITYRGKQVGERRRYDNRLAMYLLSIRRPDRYGAALATVTRQERAASRANVARTSSPSAPDRAARPPRPGRTPRAAGVARPPPSAPVHPRVRRGP